MHNMMRKGEYYIGDPCYIFPSGDEGHEEWLSFLDALPTIELPIEYRDTKLPNGVIVREPFFPEWVIEFKPFEWKGQTVLVQRTAYGDGIYSVYSRGSNIGEACVDAGLIAAVPWALVEMYAEQNGPKYEDLIPRLAVQHTFEEDFKCSYEEGLFRFGDVSIMTGDEDEEES